MSYGEGFMAEIAGNCLFIAYTLPRVKGNEDDAE